MHDGEIRQEGGRSLVWHTASGSWRPTDPEPFELVEAHGGAGWYWDPVEKAWLSDEDPVDDGFKGPGIAIRSIISDFDRDPS